MISRGHIRAVLERMTLLGLLPEDLEETFIRGSGAGGQKINKTSSTVVLRHVPSGLEVRCQKERSRTQNRFHAREELCAKLEQQRHRQQLASAAAIAKQRALTRKRSANQKRKIVEQKRQRGVVKKLRHRPGRDD